MAARQKFRDDNGAELKEILSRTDIMAVYQRVSGQSPNGLQTGRGILVRCPTGAHKDGQPSVSIDPHKKTFHSFCCEVHGTGAKNGGGILDLIVHGGAVHTRGEAVKWLKESGLVGHDFDYRKEARLEIEGLSRGGGGIPENAKLARVHPYTDAHGNVLYKVERWEYPNPKYDPNVPGSKQTSKTFRQLHAHHGDKISCTVCTPMLREDLVRAAADRKPWTSLAFKYKLDVADLKRMAHHADTAAAPPHEGEFRWGTAGCEHVPYNLPKVLAAAAAGEVIFWPEGEKCAEAVDDLGLTGTTNMGGSEWPIPASWAKYFVGARAVVQMPDADTVGRAAARRRLEVLQMSGVPGVLFEIVPEIPKPKYDIADWRDDHRHLGADERLNLLREQYRAALQAQSIEQILVISAPKLTAGNSSKYQYVHATAADAARLIKECKFAGAYIGPDCRGADMKAVVDSLVRAGVTIKASPKNRSAIAYHQHKLKTLNMPTDYQVG